MEEKKKAMWARIMPTRNKALSLSIFQLKFKKKKKRQYQHSQCFGAADFACPFLPRPPRLPKKISWSSNLN